MAAHISLLEFWSFTVSNFRMHIFSRMINPCIEVMNHDFNS